MSKLGMLQKVVSLNSERICSRRTDSMIAITRRRLSSSGIFYAGENASECTKGSKPKLVSIFQRRDLHGAFCSQTPCGCHSRLELQAPQRQMSMLDVFRRKKKVVDPNEIARDEGDDEIPGQIFTLEEEGKIQLSEEEIEEKRDKSSLKEHHRRLIHGEMPYSPSEPKFWTHNTVKYKQRTYGRYGEKSGINPGLMWPTREELKEKIEYENICNPFTIQEMVQAKQELRAAERKEIIDRQQQVESAMELVDKYKKDLHDKQRAKDKELEAATERREKLMEEVRRHFGYTVDPKDDRFKEMLEKKEKEQRKAMKEARKLDKQQRILDKLESKNPDAKTKGEKPEKPKQEDDD